MIRKSTEMGFKEIYCSNCKKTLGKYNENYFSEDKLNEIIVKNHIKCVREGHGITILRP